MKTLETLYEEVLADKELGKAFFAALSEDKLEEFAKSHGCDAGKEEVEKFLKGKQHMGELSDDELDNVAGGGCGSVAPSPCPRCGSLERMLAIHPQTRKTWVSCANCGELLRACDING